MHAGWHHARQADRVAGSCWLLRRLLAQHGSSTSYSAPLGTLLPRLDGQPPAALPGVGADALARTGRLLLGSMPNNYGSRARVKLLVRNGCSETIQVAVMFFYNPWGTPTGCKFLAT